MRQSSLGGFKMKARNPILIAFSLAARFAPAGLALAVASIVFVAAAIPARLIKKEDLRFVAGLVFP